MMGYRPTACVPALELTKIVSNFNHNNFIFVTHFVLVSI